MNQFQILWLTDDILTLKVEIILIVNQGTVSAGGLGSQALFLDSALWSHCVYLSLSSEEALSKY